MTAMPLVATFYEFGGAFKTGIGSVIGHPAAA
jgi:hypothetical protein